MKLQIYKILGCIGLLTLSCACSNSDLGNYEYNEINEISIDGIEDDYSVLLGDNFKIVPDLKMSLAKDPTADNYVFEWKAITTGLILGEDRLEVLSTKRDLDYLVSLPPSTYTVYYSVTDKETGVEWTKNFQLEVNSSISSGFMVLNDTGGGSRLDMISLIEGEFSTYHDVLAKMGSSLTLEGTPVDISCYRFESTLYGIYVSTTENGTTKIDPNNFSWESPLRLSYEMIGPDIPLDYRADFIHPLGFRESFMFKEGNLYYYNFLYGHRYGEPINRVSGEGSTFEVAPYVGANIKTESWGPRIIFDNTNKRFVRHSFGTVTCTLLPEGGLFDYNIGMDLVYMEKNEYNGGSVYAVLKDPADNKPYMARMAATWSGVSQNYYSEITAENFDQAEHFAVSPLLGYLFYSVGGKVYEYDLSLKTSKLMLDFGSDEVTKLSFHITNEAELDNKLVVSTYGDTQGSGKLGIYEVPPINADLELYREFGGFEKIIDIDYRVR